MIPFWMSSNYNSSYTNKNSFNS